MHEDTLECCRLGQADGSVIPGVGKRLQRRTLERRVR